VVEVERRRLGVGDVGAAALLDQDAAGRGDAATIKAMTRFPLMFAGAPLGADRFETLWMGLFNPLNRACLAKAKPVAEGEAMEAFCNGTIFLFARDAKGWRFTEIGADD